MARRKFTVPDMACSGCAETITKAIQGIDGLASVDADPSTKVVVIDSGVSDASLKEAIATAGYTVA